MRKQEITLPDIKKALFDPDQIKRSDDMKWRIGVAAQPVASVSPDRRQKAYAMLSPSSTKVERTSPFPYRPEVVIGGFCSIFTGDLANGKVKDAVGQVRMDQVVESVGNVRGKPIFTIFEDSFFERLTGLPRTEIQKQARDATTRISRWLKLSTQQSPDLLTAYTSNPGVEQGLTDAVAYFAEDVLKNPDFRRIQAAPILMMYTSLWPELLSSLGIIPSPQVICVEPVIHFVDDRSFPDATLNRAYVAFLEWLRENPYGENGSRNQAFAIAGFMESYSGDQTKRRTRLFPYTDVPTTANYRQWTEQLAADVERFPFPLRNSLIFAEAVNWGLWNPEIRDGIGSLIDLEDEYYATKKCVAKQNNRTENQASVQRLRTMFDDRARPFLTRLVHQTETILNTVLGE